MPLGAVEKKATRTGVQKDALQLMGACEFCHSEYDGMRHLPWPGGAIRALVRAAVTGAQGSRDLQQAVQGQASLPVDQHLMRLIDLSGCRGRTTAVRVGSHLPHSSCTKFSSSVIIQL